jgi:hypothetical protein
MVHPFPRTALEKHDRPIAETSGQPTVAAKSIYCSGAK